MASNSPGTRPPRRCRLGLVQYTEGQAELDLQRRAYIRRAQKIVTTLLLLFAIALIPATEAVFVDFQNCLQPAIVHSSPVQLQFVPYFLDAKFNKSESKHNLNITVYGNVTGQSTTDDLPPFGDPRWDDRNFTLGKIPDSSDNFTTLFQRYDVLTFTPYTAEPDRFCNTTINSTCPLGPSFGGNRSDPYSLSTFTVAHDFFSSFAFSTFAVTLSIQSGDKGAPSLGCISSSITPDLGYGLSATFTFIPVIILLLVGVATVFAACFSPWSPPDFFSWSSNYGRDEDLIRLVTPGFGDCLQYIQFVVLAGSLSLNYPGYYQPVVSQASWSVIMFNQSFVSGKNGTQSLIDGVYHTVADSYGLSKLRQLVGMSEDKDVWAGMAIWLLIIVGAVILLSQLGFFFRWAYQQVRNAQQEDLRSKNWPFTAGNVVRTVFNYLLLPIVALSTFQLVLAPQSPASVVAMAVVLLIAVLSFAGWIFHLIIRTRPRIHLFDDLPLLLLYGPLYNTYSDEAAPFAFIPILLNLTRGIAIGGVQQSGIAQLVILASCEVVLILMLHAFRPFQSLTSMNAYHTFFSVVRLITTLLMVAFIPSLGVSEGSRGWLGYAILLLHAIVLVFGFFLNSIQTLIEVAARLAGAGGEARGGLSTVFGMRQLSKRARRQRQARDSLNSDASMLAAQHHHPDGRVRGRSLSASSAILLSQQSPPNARESSVFDNFSQSGAVSGPSTPGGGQNPFNYLGGSSAATSRRPTMGTGDSTRPLQPSDPYYRPPRQRRPTLEAVGGVAAPQRESDVSSGDLGIKPALDSPTRQSFSAEPGEGPSSFSPNRASLNPAYLRTLANDSDTALSEHPRAHIDYATRESDFYYGVRGPALSSMPSRKLKTGPADPVGPATSATMWFRNMFGASKKSKGKGFEVVRSTPLHLLRAEETSPPLDQEPYKDDPGAGAGRGGSRALGSDSASGTPLQPYKDKFSDDDPSPDDTPRVSATAPSLGAIDLGGGIELPSRIGSKASAKTPTNAAATGAAPSVPRRSSRRTPSATGDHRTGTDYLAPQGRGGAVRMPFEGGSGEPSPSPERSGGLSMTSTTSSVYPTDETPTPNTQQGHASADAGDGTAGAERGRAGATRARPVSTGHVIHHLASESIHPSVYEEAPAMPRASQAEVFGYKDMRGTSPPARGGSGRSREERGGY